MIDRITSRLYEGVLDLGTWSGGLHALLMGLDAAAFHQMDIHREGFAARSIAASMRGGEAPSEKVQEFERHYAPQDIRFPAMWGVHEGGVWWDHEHFSAATFRSAPVYTEFLASVGLRHTVAVPLRDGAQSRDFVGFFRHIDQAPFGAREQQILAQCLPHMVRANKLRHRAAQLAEQAALGAAALDALPQALAVADAGLRLRYLNAAAEHMLAGPGGLTLRHGALRASDPATQCHLAQCAATACGLGGPARAGVVRIAPASGQAPGPVIVHVLPLQASHPLAQALHGIPHALLVWAAPLSSHKVTHIGTALGLSEVEARLALMLAQGLTVKDFARAQDCTWHTARTHMKNLLRKTGLHRQQDVVALVRGLA